jgi:hypothetical protein
MEEILETHPSGNPKKIVIRGGTIQGCDVIKTYSSKGDLENVTFGYIASDGMELTVSSSGEDRYSTYYMKDGEKIFHNPDGPAIVSTHKKGGGHNSKGMWMGSIIIDAVYIIHGKRIEDGPAAVSFMCGNDRVYVTREEWYEGDSKIKEIDFEHANGRLLSETVYEKSSSRFPKKLRITVFQADGTIHYIKHGDHTFNGGDGITNEMNPDVRELSEGYVEIKPENRNIGYTHSRSIRQMLGWQLNENSKLEFIYDNIIQKEVSVS